VCCTGTSYNLYSDYNFFLHNPKKSEKKRVSFNYNKQISKSTEKIYLLLSRYRKK